MIDLAVLIPLAVAAVSAIVGPMVVLRKQHNHELRLRQLQQENSDQHAEGRALVGELHEDVKGLLGHVGRIDERTEHVVNGVESIRQWVHDHEIRHAVDAMKAQQRDT
jgi:hypothetical protein